MISLDSQATQIQCYLLNLIYLQSFLPWLMIDFQHLYYFHRCYFYHLASYVIFGILLIPDILQLKSLIV